MKNIVQGASVGQAALYARSWYSYYMDKEYPSEARGLKTLAQFVVYGDVSAKPFRTHKKIVPPNNYAKSGNIIKRAESVKYLPIKTPRSIKRELMKRLAEYLDGGRITFQSFEIHTPPDEVFNLPAAIHTAKSIRFKGRNMEVRGVEKVVKHGEDVEPGTDDYSFEGYGYRGDDAKSWRTFSSK
jgi:hypothetical protein